MSDEKEKSSENSLVGVVRAVTPGIVRRSFALKFGLVLLVMALSIGGIGFVATEKISAETADNVESEYQNVAASETAIVEGWLEQHTLSTEYISREPALLGNNTLSTRDALRAGQQDLGESAYAVHLVNASLDEEVRVVSSPSAAVQPGATLSDTQRGWVPERLDEARDLTESGVLVQETYMVDDRQVIAFLSPVRGSDNRYVVLEMDISGVTETLQGKERAEGGFTQVVSTDDNRVAISNGVESVGSQYAEEEAANQPLESANSLRQQSEEAGVIASMSASSVLDEEYTVGYAPVDGTDWVVVTHAPRSSVFGFVQTISNWGLLATIGAVLLIGITGTAIGYSTSTAIDRLTRKTEQMRAGNLDVTLTTPRIDNIGRLYGGFAEMRDSLKEQIDEAERAKKEAEVSRAEALELSNHLQSQAENYSQIMQKCAAGDLTRRMDRDKDNESMDRIAGEFNNMIEELEKTTGQLKSYVNEVEEAGEEVEQSATTVRKASEEVADSIQKIAVDAEDQKVRLQTISETVDDIADELELSATDELPTPIDAQLERIEGIATEITEIADLSKETQAETDNVSAAAEEQAAELNEVSERANDLQRYAQPLRDILDRFETEAEHEFVFSVGPTGSANQPMDED